jgi:hypothetical protein
MKRRDTFAALGLAGLGSILPELAAAAAAGELTEDQVAALLRQVAGVEARPGEAARVRDALKEARATAETDPRVQPALGFDPEVEP